MFESERPQRIEVKKIRPLQKSIAVMQRRGREGPEINRPDDNAQQDSMRADPPCSQRRARDGVFGLHPAAEILYAATWGADSCV